MVSKRKTSFEMQQTRRSVLRMGAGGLLAVGLVACGGGGGGDDSEGIDLRAAYDRVGEGMTRAEVVRAVGREPNSVTSDETMLWDESDQLLWVDISDATGMTYWARWKKFTNPSADLRKDFS